MTILQELVALYDARAEKEEWPRPGFSAENIGAVVVLSEDGSVLEIRRLGSFAKSSFVPQKLSVPAAVKRTAGIKPNIFWDKTSYVMGVTETADGPGQGKRTVAEHTAFKEVHLTLLEGTTHPALMALKLFCETWKPDAFSSFADAAELIDQNVVFSLRGGPYLHDLPDAHVMLATSETGKTTCLVSGKSGSVARLHPSIKGVLGAQSSGASLVSFNNSAETSHGKTQGDNAPVSEGAAFAYGTALNALLAKGSGNTLRIGGDTVVFWADVPEAEDWVQAFWSGSNDAGADRELAERVRAIAEGRMRKDQAIDPKARLFVLGLAPNAARLSVRYWHPGTLQGFATCVTRFWDDLAIEPSPFLREGIAQPPKPWRLLYDVAAQGDAGNIPAGLGGDLMRALLTGGRFPATWLAAVMGRIRVEGEPDRSRHGNVDGRRAAAIAAVLRRNYKQEVPMALEDDAQDAAYLLGRLFGAYTYAEKSYQERGAGLRQKYIGAASATPARIFPVLMRGYEHNLSSLRKAGGQKAGAGVKADRAVAAIIEKLNGDLPASLPLEAQGRFFIGFYHQISAFYAKAEDAADALIETDDGEGDA